jgi:ATP-binding cassette subfamily B protein
MNQAMPEKQDQFQRIRHLIRDEKRRYLLAFGALVAGTLLLYMVPLVPLAVLDVSLGSDPEKASALSRGLIEILGGRELVRENLWIPGLAIAAVAIGAGIFVHLRQRFAAKAAQNLAVRLRKRIYDHVQRLSCRSLEKLESGDLLQRCTSDVDTVVLFLSEQVMMMGRAVAMVLVPLPLMFAIDWRMSLVSFILILPISFFSFIFFKRMRENFLEKDRAEGRLTATVNENLNGIRVVRSFARQAFEEERFDERNVAHRDLDNRLYVLMSRFWSLSDLLCFAQQGLVLGFGLWWLTAGSLEVGAFYFFVSAVGMFLWPVRMSGRILAELGKALVAVGRIGEILDTPLETEPENPLVPDELGGSIRFDDVQLHHGELPVLDGMSFEIQAGETVALVGPAGSGKTTIVDLLLRLHDPDGGEVFIGNVPLQQLKREFVRARIAVVMQQPFLYSRSIRENIAITQPEIGNESIEAAAADACVHESIRSFDQGYETVVGERGLTLSGGQRQRVAIARALVQRPAILVLDDALSAVDTHTESDILEALARRRGRHTTLLIAHRLSTLKQADRILVIESGRISQEGTHEKLIEEDGLYQRIWRIQGSQQDDGTDHQGGAA